MKKLLIILIISLVFIINGCTIKENTKPNSSNLISNNSSNISSSISPMPTATINPNAKLAITPIAKSQNNFGAKSSYWVALSNDSAVLFDFNKTLMVINTNDFTVISKYEFGEKTELNHLKNTKNSILFVSNEFAFLFDNKLSLIQKVAIKNFTEGLSEFNNFDISSDLKSVVYTNDVGVYISDISNSNAKLIAKHENRSDDTEAKIFKYPQFADNDSKVLVRGVAWENVYTMLCYDIKSETIKKYDVDTSHEFTFQVLDDKCVFLGKDIETLDFKTMDLSSEKITFSGSPEGFISNGNIIVISDNGPMDDKTDCKIYKYNIKTKSYASTTVGTDGAYFEIKAVLPNDTVIISDNEAFYRIKLN